MAFPVFEFDLHKPVSTQHQAYGAMVFRLISGKVQDSTEGFVVLLLQHFFGDGDVELLMLVT